MLALLYLIVCVSIAIEAVSLALIIGNERLRRRSNALNEQIALRNAEVYAQWQADNSKGTT